MKFNDISHKYRTELLLFGGIFTLIRTEILHFSGFSLGGRTFGTSVYISMKHTDILILNSRHLLYNVLISIKFNKTYSDTSFLLNDVVLRLDV